MQQPPPAPGNIDAELAANRESIPEVVVDTTPAMTKTLEPQQSQFKKWMYHEGTILWDLLASSYLNILLIVVPVALGLGFAHAESVAVFVLNFIALIPLALLLGDITEHLAERFGDVVGGLLNATFGNVVEIVLAIQALRKNLIMLVEMSLIGSVLSNLLLVLGFSFIVGGSYHHTQVFSTDAIQSQNTLLFLAAIGMCIPTAAPYFNVGMADHVNAIGHASAVLMFCSYLLYLYFQLYTHKELNEDEDDEEDEEEQQQQQLEQRPEEEALVSHDEDGGPYVYHPAPRARGGALKTVQSGRVLSKLEQLAHPGAPLDLNHQRAAVGRSVSGKAMDVAAAHGVSAELLRHRTRSGPANTMQASAWQEPVGRPIEVVRTASGQLVEMVRTPSGRLVQLMAPVNEVHSGEVHARQAAAAGRVLGGPSSRSIPLPLVDRSASGRHVVVTGSGRRMTDLELHDINRARRISGRPSLKNVVVVVPPPDHTSEADDTLPLEQVVLGLGAEAEAGAGVGAAEEVASITTTILSVPVALAALSCIAVLVAIHCEFLTEVIQEFGDETGLSQPFIGMIILPIAGNACEHLVAVVMAAKGRMNLALGIAVGSSLQIALLAIPFIALVAWGMGRDFNLNIDTYALFCLLFSIIVAFQILSAGKSTWISGVAPIVIYVIIAVSYLYSNQTVDFGR